MKKSAYVTIAFAIVTTSIFALDVSYETGRDESIKKDRSMSVKKGNEQRSSNRKFDTSTDSKSYSADVTFDPIPIYMIRANSCVQSLSVAADFGLSAVIDEDGGVIDLNKKAYIDNAASSSMKVSAIDGVDEGAIKKHIACILGETAKMAQANLYLQQKLGGKNFTIKQASAVAVYTFDNVDKLTDPSIRLQYKQAINSLRQPCRFLANLGRDSIQCGTLSFSFTDNSIKQSGVLLSAGNGFFGMGSTLRISMGDTNAVGRDVASENSKSASRDATLSKTGSNSQSLGGKQQTNVSPFLPK